MKAVIFDMDGLMVNSEPLARQAWDAVLGTYGARLDGETYRGMIGLRLDESAKLVRDAYGLADDPATIAERKQHHLAQIRRGGVPIMPGLWRLLEEIERRRLPWAVASSSKRDDVLAVLRQLDLLNVCWAIAAGGLVSRRKRGQ